MNFNLDKTEHHIVFQSVRSLMTVAGLAGIVILFIQSGTGTFFETFDRLSNAIQILSGITG